MITASQLSRIAACPASASLPKVRSTSVHAQRGTAIHRFLADAKGHGRDGALARVPADWRPVCEAIDLDALPVTLMAEATYALDVTTGKARWLGQDLDRNYAAAHPHEWVGTADVVGIDEEHLYVGDYFTGWIEPDKDWQLKFLALAAARHYGCSEATVEVIRIREDGSVYRTSETLDAMDLDAVAAELRVLHATVAATAALIASGQTPDVTTGPHCRYCPSWDSCPGQTGLIRLAAGGGDVAGPFLQGGLSRGMVGAAYVLAEQLRAVAKELEKRVHGAIDEFGEVPTPRGTVLRKALVEGHEKIDGEAAVRVLSDRYGPDVVGACTEVTVTKKRLGEGLRKHLGRSGAQAERDVLDALRRAGGVTRSQSEKLIEVDSKKGAA